MNPTPSRESYTETEAVNEARRCLQCTDPHCNQGCPAQVDVRKFVGSIATGNFPGAIRALKTCNALPLSCAFICPVERQCEERCRNSELNYPITIARLQRFISEYALDHDLLPREPGPPTGHRVAVIGAGPAGIAAAIELRLAGHAVTVFEARKGAGGMLSQAIPDDRLPPHVVARELKEMDALGAEVRLGEAVTDLDAVFDQGFDAVLLAIGCWSSARLPLESDGLQGIFGALEFLADAKDPDASSPEVGKRVVVIGGGSVAMDAARTAYRLGAEQVEIASLESPQEMPGTREEIGHAWEMGVLFHSRVRPLRYAAHDGRVTGVDFIRIDWREPGVFTPDNAVDREDTEFHLPADTVIEAIGQRPDDAAEKLLTGLDCERGRLVVRRETMMTSREGVFAAGDILIDGGTTVVRSVHDGRHAAAGIHAYLEQKAGTKT